MAYRERTPINLGAFQSAETLTAHPPYHRWLRAGLVVVSLVLVFALGVSCTSATQSGSPATAGGGASLVFDQTEVDFGKVPFNKTVEHSFVYRNVGAQPVTIVERPKVDIVEGC